MSYLARISARVAGPGAPARAVMPKGLAHAPTPAVARSSAADAQADEALRPPEEGSGEELTRLDRQETGEEEQLATVRRQDAEDEEEMAAPLRRQEEEEEEESLQTLRRLAEEEEAPIQTLHRQVEEEEESLQTLRRQEEEQQEDPLQTLHRQQEAEDDAAVQPMWSIVRQEEVPLEETGQTVPPPTQESLDPDAGPVDQELADEEEPSGLQALHREVPSMPAPSATAPEASLANGPLGQTVAPGPSYLPQSPDGIETPQAVPQPVGADSRRPQVIIDQVDVLIHETVSFPDRSAQRHSRDRAMRARYLRRL